MIITDQQPEQAPWSPKRLDCPQHMVFGHAPPQPYAAEGASSQQEQQVVYHPHLEGRQVPFPLRSSGTPNQASMWGSPPFFSTGPQLGSPASLSSVSSSTPSASSAPGAPASHGAHSGRQTYPMESLGSSNPAVTSWPPYDGLAFPQRLARQTSIAQGYHTAPMQPTGEVSASPGNYNHTLQSNQVNEVTPSSMYWPDTAKHFHPAATATDSSTHQPPLYHQRQDSDPQPSHPNRSVLTALPVPPSKKNLANSAAQRKQNRHLACTFCRGRKLRCIIDDEGGTVCRQCQRRNLDCSLPHPISEQEPEVPKAKKRRASGPASASLPGSRESGVADSATGNKKGRRTSAHPEAATTQRLVGESGRSGVASDVVLMGTTRPVQACDDGWEVGPTTRPYQDSQAGDLLSNFSTQQPDAVLPGLNRSDQYGLFPDASANALAGTGEADTGVVDEIIRAPPPQPGKGSADWWERCLSVFGPRPQR